METITYREFLHKLYENESRGSGGYEAVNYAGYLGRYQMGTLALRDAHYMHSQRKWVGTNNIFSADDFLNSPIAQEDAVRKYHAKIWQTIRNKKLDRYIGQTINGIEITPYGLLAGYHLKGNDVEKFLESDGKIDPTDGNGTPVSKYMREIAGYGDDFPTSDGLNIPTDNDAFYTPFINLFNFEENETGVTNRRNFVGQSVGFSASSLAQQGAKNL